MKLKELQDAMIAAMKAKDKFRKDAISALVSAVKKKGIDNGCRDNIPDEMANEAILKEIKSVKEQIIYSFKLGEEIPLYGSMTVADTAGNGSDGS